MIVKAAHLIRLATGLLPDSHAVPRPLLLRARRIFALACLIDTPQFVSDGCFRVAEWDPVDIVRFIRSHVPTSLSEDAVSLRAQVLADTDEQIVEAITYMRGVLATKCATFGTLRFLDLGRLRPTLHPIHEEEEDVPSAYRIRAMAS